MEMQLAHAMHIYSNVGLHGSGVFAQLRSI